MQFLSNQHLQNCRFTVNRYEALAQLKPVSVIAEVGVLAGDLSSWMLSHLEPTQLHLIDLYTCADFPGKDRFSKRQHEEFVANRFEDEIRQGRVIMKKGYSWKVLEEYQDGYFDLIYIDAAHDYASVKKDLAVSASKIKSSGRIMMNDYIMYDHLAKSRYGVVEATNEFCVEQQWEFEFFAFHPNLFCDVVLKKMT